MYHSPTLCVIDRDITPLFYYERYIIHHSNDSIAWLITVQIASAFTFRQMKRSNTTIKIFA
jgi:hypothetical protein